MDGKIMLALFAALCGAGWYLSTQDITVGNVPSGPSERPARLAEVVNLRHDTIRRELLLAGHDVTDPASFVFDRDGLDIVGGPIAATEHGAPVFLEAVFPWHATPRASDSPGRIAPVPAVRGCRPAAPAAGARVANVFTGPTLRRVSLFAYTEAELDARAWEALAEPEPEPQQGGAAGLAAFAPSTMMAKATGAGGPAEAWGFTLMDVAVGETDMPVHLVLQSGGGRVMWNLSLAPGARVAGVTLLGGTISALTNLPDRTPVEAMNDAALAACGIVPARRPLRSDPLFAGLEEEGADLAAARPALEARAAAVAVWNEWFEEVFGVRDTATRIGHDIGAIAALVGPVPQTEAARIGWHGYAERPVRIGPAAGHIAALPAKADGRLRMRIDKRAKALAKDDLASLAPGGQ